MLWSGADTTNSVWESDTWAGRVRTETALRALSTAVPKIPQRKTESVEKASVSIQQAAVAGGDSFSTTLERSTTPSSNTISTIPTIQTQTVAAANVGSIPTIALQSDSNTRSTTSGSDYRATASISGNIGISIAAPELIPLVGKATIATSGENALVYENVPTLRASVNTDVTAEITETIIAAIPQFVGVIAESTDEISITEEVATLSVSASSSGIAVAEAISNESVAIQAHSTTVPNTITGANEITTSVSRDINNITGATATITGGTESTLSFEGANLTPTAVIPQASNEIYSAIERATITNSSSNLFNATNALSVSPDAIVSIPTEIILSDSQQINSAVDYTEIDAETNIVSLEPSANEVVIDK